MIATLMLPLLLQLGSIPQPPYEAEVSEEVRTVLDERDNLPPELLQQRLVALAESGDDSAAELLGEILSGGLFGVERDLTRACDYFEALGDRRPDGLHNQATCYYDGEGRPQDLARARTLYAQAAAAGWVQAWCAYGNMLLRGEGGPTDEAEGLRLCRTASAAGDRNAQTDYGGYLLMGVGTERDAVAARFILEQAAAQEQANAAFLLGQIHTKGDGTPTDNAAASEWFAKAFEWGRTDAAYEAANSNFRRGFIEQEDGSVTLRPALLRESQQWVQVAKQIETEGSERHQLMLQLEQVLVNLIARAGSD